VPHAGHQVGNDSCRIEPAYRSPDQVAVGRQGSAFGWIPRWQTGRVGWATIEATVRAEWGLEVRRPASVDIALNSRVWAVRTDTGPVMLKLVGGRDPFVAGLEIADRLAVDMRSGPPVRTRRGQLAVETSDGWLAMLRREPGRPLRLSHESDRRRWGACLGDLHRRLVELDISEPLPTWPWDWLDIDADHLCGDPSLRDAIAKARVAAERYVACHHPDIGVIHGDPNPQEFLLDRTGDVAVIDWGAAQRGPLLYDVASARRFAGSDDSFQVALDAYQRSNGSTVPTTGLRVFLRYREAVQAWYFSYRLANNDTDGADRAFDQAGLHHARTALDAIDAL
jgi:Phosphotransferase enzyme family